jgi:hypothetical protein
MAALAAGVPLTLLADLADPAMGWLHGLAYPTVEPEAGADCTAV